MQRILALFDFDGTMIQGDSIIGLVRRMVRQGLMPIPELIRVLWKTLLWKLGRYPVEKAKTLSLAPLARMKPEAAATFCRSFVQEELLPRIYPDALQAMQAHQDAGHLVLLVSASPLLYLQYLKEGLPVDHIIGTVTDAQLQVTANVVGEEKIRQIEAWLRQEGIKADWAQSSAYGDSAKDLPMLGLVGKPMLINPHKKALRLGRGIPSKDWR